MDRGKLGLRIRRATGRGLISVLAGLRATRTWRAIAEEFWHDAPASTELGRLDAAFRAASAA